MNKRTGLRKKIAQAKRQYQEVMSRNDAPRWERLQAWKRVYGLELELRTQQATA